MSHKWSFLAGIVLGAMLVLAVIFVLSLASPSQAAENRASIQVQETPQACRSVSVFEVNGSEIKTITIEYQGCEGMTDK